MKLASYNAFANLLLAGGLMLASTKTLAITSENQQSIYINSEKQAVDIANNTVTLTGKVVVKRGSINIYADKVAISYTNTKNSNAIVEAFGNPVIFYQLQNNGKSVRGHSQKVRYETAADLVILTGNACLEQLESNVKGDRITYLIKKRHIKAFSSKGKQVATLLVPVQLQDKKTLMY